MLTLEDKRKQSYAFTICMHTHAQTHTLTLKHTFVQLPWIRMCVCVCVKLHSKEKHTERVCTTQLSRGSTWK